jgi:hypothetical protein
MAAFVVRLPQSSQTPYEVNRAMMDILRDRPPEARNPSE